MNEEQKPEVHDSRCKRNQLWPDHAEAVCTCVTARRLPVHELRQKCNAVLERDLNLVVPHHGVVAQKRRKKWRNKQCEDAVILARELLQRMEAEARGLPAQVVLADAVTHEQAEHIVNSLVQSIEVPCELDVQPLRAYIAQQRGGGHGG